MRWIVAALLISFLLHLPYFRVGMISDEGGYAYVAQHWLDGRGKLYDDIWVSRPQGIFVAYAAIMKTIGTSVADLRFGAWLVSLATMIPVYAITRISAGRRAARLALIIFAITSGSPAIEGFTANAEVFMALPAALSAWLLLRSWQQNWNWHQLALTGAAAAIAAQLKPSGIVMIPLAIVFCWLVGQGGIRVFIRRSSWILLGAGLALLPALVHGWLVGWDNFVFAAFTYRITSQSTVTADWNYQLLQIARLLFRMTPLILIALVALGTRQRQQASSLPLFAVSGGSQFAPAQSGRRDIWAVGSSHPVRIMLWLWMLACIGGIAMGGDWWYHYAIQIVAPVSILLAPLLLQVWDHLRPIPRRGFIVFSLGLLLLPYALTARPDAATTTIRVFPFQGYERQDAVADYVRTHGDPDGSLLVAFDQAALYYLSRRTAAFRYMYTQEMAAIPQAEAMMVTIVLGNDRPEFVIDTGEPAPFQDGGAAFWAAVQQHYDMVTVINGFRIYQRHD